MSLKSNAKAYGKVQLICPCQQQQSNPNAYKHCCEPYHQGRVAESPEKLMRSRFSAYAMGLGNYVKQSWHVSTCPDDLNLESDDQWVKLDIVSSNQKQVHFKAYFKNEHHSAESMGHYSLLEEVSHFVLEKEKWFYVSGDTQITEYKQQRNEPCLCGSGKKYKKCCALSS